MNNYTPIEYVTREGQLKIAFAQCKSSDLKLVFAASTRRKIKDDLMIHFDFIVSSLDKIPEIQTLVEENSKIKLTEEESGYFGI